MISKTKMTQQLFGTSGIRKKVTELSPEFAVNVGASLGTYSMDEAIVVGRDTRTSSQMLEFALVSGLLSTGKRVVRLGVVPTPTVGVATQDYGTGIMITASHNPPEYNGFKFWGANGGFSSKQEREIENIFLSGNFKRASWKKIGEIKERNYIDKHINLILDHIEIERKIKVVIDCANSAGSFLTPYLLRKLGCEVIALNSQPDGFFPCHELEPTKENLEDTIKAVRGVNADIGIVHDGDADRTAVISKDGSLIDWDDLLALLAYGKNKVVTTVDASMRIEDVCKKVIRTRVGDVAVAEAIKKESADFGGEPSGSFIFPNLHLFPDGPLAAAIVVQMVSEGKFYEILKEIPSYPTKRVKIPCEDELKSILMEKLKETISGEIDTTDGIRIRTDDGWILIRPSGTEPYVRITAEGKDEKTLNELVKMGKAWIKEAMYRR